MLSLAGPTATAPEALSDALYHLESNGLRRPKADGRVKVSAERSKVGHADLTDVTNCSLGDDRPEASAQRTPPRRWEPPTPPSAPGMMSA